jgi:hypothetical protein
VFGFPAQRGKSKDMWQRFFHAFLMALLLLGGMAWAQGLGDFQDQGQQQPLQNDLLNNGQQSLDLSIDRANSQAKQKKPTRVTTIKKSAEIGNPKAASFGPSSRQFGISHSPSKESQFGSLGIGAIGKGYDPSSSFSSKSFLDGYLLKSLHDDSISSKRTRKEGKAEDDLRLKGKPSF